MTGALLYNQGRFAQVLEGPFGAVQSTYERIQADERHADLVVLQAEPVSVRSFALWAMALATPEDPAGASRLLSRVLGDVGKGTKGVLALLDLLRQGEPDVLAAG